MPALPRIAVRYLVGRVTDEGNTLNPYNAGVFLEIVFYEFEAILIV